MVESDDAWIRFGRVDPYLRTVKTLTIAVLFEPNVYVNVVVCADTQTDVAAEGRTVTVVARDIVAQSVRFVP